tara:strand:+ start:4543 stop:5082 length:540 start_codon:yes stop_codon:yes gene_type:complete
MGWLSDKLFGKRKSLDLNKLKGYMQPTQNLLDKTLAGYEGLMDPNSEMNQGMIRHMQQQAQTQGAQIGQQVQKIGAMRNVSPAQAMMQARMAMNNSLGSLQGRELDFLQQQYSQGLGGMMGITQMQQGLNENEANAYVQSINAHNAKRQGRMNFATGLLGTAVSAFTGGIGGGGGGGNS